MDFTSKFWGVWWIVVLLFFVQHFPSILLSTKKLAWISPRLVMSRCWPFQPTVRFLWFPDDLCREPFTQQLGPNLTDRILRNKSDSNLFRMSKCSGGLVVFTCEDAEMYNSHWHIYGIHWHTISIMKPLSIPTSILETSPFPTPSNESMMTLCTSGNTTTSAVTASTEKSSRQWVETASTEGNHPVVLKPLTEESIAPTTSWASGFGLQGYKFTQNIHPSTAEVVG